MPEVDYLILQKTNTAQYRTASEATGRKHACARAKALNAKKPGQYVLLNLRTRLIEEWNTREARA